MEHDIAEHHRIVAGAFTERVLGTTDWSVPTPVDGWTALDVVDHLVEWFTGFLFASADIELPEAPPVHADPVAAWLAHRDAVQALLEDPATAERMLHNPHVGEMPLPLGIERFWTPDVFMHTWDLARATGQDDRLDAGYCAALLEGMEPLEDLIRGSGQFGTRQPVADDADAQTRLIAFIGRDPSWSPLR